MGTREILEKRRGHGQEVPLGGEEEKSFEPLEPGNFAKPDKTGVSKSVSKTIQKTKFFCLSLTLRSTNQAKEKSRTKAYLWGIMR